jgi:hypothetical protein
VALGLLYLAPVVENRTKKKLPGYEAGGVLWREPRDIASRNLYLGIGGNDQKPDLRSVRYLRDKKGGASTKYRVEDGSGREWMAKIGEEAQSECAADRLVWAVGYTTDATYLVPHLNIEGKGAFDNVLLKARPKGIKRESAWKWNNNPFIGTMAFQGLKVMMALTNNWDLKTDNNRILMAKHSDEDARPLYIISDLGATFGKSSGCSLLWRFTRNRNRPEDYAKSRFIDKVKDGRVYFKWHTKNSGMFNDVTVEQAKWIGDRLKELSPKQIGDAFRAANYSDREVGLLTNAVERRIDELVALPPGGPPLAKAGPALKRRRPTETQKQ